MTTKAGEFHDSSEQQNGALALRTDIATSAPVTPSATPLPEQGSPPTTILDAPKTLTSDPADFTQVDAASAPVTQSKHYDAGYVPRHLRRVLKDNKWIYEVPESENKDIYQDLNTFPDEKEFTLQIVTFFMKEEKRTEWGDPFVYNKANKDNKREVLDKISLRLKKDAAASGSPESPPATWRWIHCEGLNGEMLKIVANETEWPASLFAGVFTWTRPSVELAKGRLLMQLIDQGTHLYVLWTTKGQIPTFITCSTLHPRKQLIDRLGRYVDRGDSRPELNPRKDPSLMFYNLLRALVQDLRASGYQVRDSVEKAYDRAMSHPSQDNLAFFYQLRQKLLRVKLDATGLEPAASNLKIIAKAINKPLANGRPQLISTQTYERLDDQLNLVTLLVTELPDISGQADAVGSLAFNILTFNANQFLKILAILTIIAAPLSVTSAILSTLETTSTPMDRAIVVKVLISVGCFSAFLLVAFLAGIRLSFRFPGRNAPILNWDKEQPDFAEGDYATGYTNLFHLRMENEFRRYRGARSKANSMMPDEHSYTQANSFDTAQPRSSRSTVMPFLPSIFSRLQTPPPSSAEELV